MQHRSLALLCSVRSHGEHGVVARILTPDKGLVAGYVRAGRSRALRPVLVPGNKITAERRQRHPDQLASLDVELVDSRAPLMTEPLAAVGIDWTCALVASCLPEEEPFPHVYDAMDGLLGAIAAAPSARRWAGAMANFERLLMQSLGYGGTLPLVGEDWPSVIAGLTANGAQLSRHLLTDRRRDILPARERMMDRFKRAVA
ncbi:MAG: DNA repair protein RecO [Sphingomonadaceae bacterium]|nr:DNA repair protein RecO [Sphingomonadaceae bacterium]NBU78005.1 DNA repair protein RecO [Sphingomonadaceae bacterium]NCA02308.1 DNA repair protein RecO [Sphingomonadaceae bacterium]